MMKWNDIPKVKVKKAMMQFLHEAGQAGVTQTVFNSHVLTGFYRNAVMYKLSTGEKSGFGSMPGLEGEVKKPDIEISRPKKWIVKVGLNLIYAARLERRFGIVAKSLDDIQPQLKPLMQRVIKENL